MGASKKKREQFLSDHPACYFCGSPATTIDHVPSRQCFLDRIGPEGFEFPACARCNNSAGQIEQVVALYLRLADHDGSSHHERHILGLLSGVLNNNAALLPSDDATTNDKRRAVRSSRFPLAVGETYSSAPVLRLPDENRKAFELFERRIVCALYYKHIGRVLPLRYLIRTHRTQFISRHAEELVEKMAPMLPGVVRAQRQNTNIGDQFMYVWYANEAGDIFAFLAQFSQSFMFVGVACSPEHDDGSPGYARHYDDIS